MENVYLIKKENFSVSNFSGKTGLLCNQTSYWLAEKKYLFEILQETSDFKALFVPEHGLFAELQDQEVLKNINHYSFLKPSVEIISLYGHSQESVFVPAQKLKNIDTLFIDILDIGSRYYTYITTIANIFKAIKKYNIKTEIVVFDRPNPAGNSVEGTIIEKKFSSFIGHTGLPHRHGLTLGELSLFLKNQISANFPLKIILHNNTQNIDIQPSPNIPTQNTINVYSGQCLFEGTNMSEGRGTTKPFEIVGLPNISWENLIRIRTRIEKIYKNKLPVHLRPLKFIPTFHKHQNQVCTGFQLHVVQKKFHALIFSILLLRAFSEICPKKFWRVGIYEKGNNKTAIELLAGDQDIVDFLKGKNNFDKLCDKIKSAENQWMKNSEKFLIYKRVLKTYFPFSKTK